MYRKLGGILALLILASLPARTNAQELKSLNALAKGHGTMISNGLDKYEITGVLVLLRENGDSQITLYSAIQIQSLGHWTRGSDPGVIDLQMGGGVGADSNIAGKLTLGEDQKTIVKLTAGGQGMSGIKYEINFVADKTETPPR